MKIILSPSKTMKPCRSEYLKDKELLLPKEHKKILAQLRKLKKKELGVALSIKGDILDNTFLNIKNYSKLEEYHAFDSFTGLVYFNIDKPSYKEEEYAYIENHLLILDAFYGVLEPGTLIKPYRLDMKAKIGVNLYKHWNLESIINDPLIINLASTEFHKMISKPMVTVHFLQKKEEKYLNQATYSKQARGLFFDFLVKNKITSNEDMKAFNLDNYAFNFELSDESNITFTR